MAVKKDAFKKGLGKPKASSGVSESFATMLGVDAAVAKVIDIDISLLDSHPKQNIFSMNEHELKWLSENIKEVGVLDPIHVKPTGDGRYTILAGHRRTEASKLAGINKIPAIIQNVDDETADIIFTATNLGARGRLLPSEKAYGYTELEQALIARGVKKGLTTSKIADGTGEHVKQIYRYKRLTKLIDKLLEMVDKEIIPINIGVELSYLSFLSQEFLSEIIQESKIRLTLEQAKGLRSIEDGRKIVKDDLLAILLPTVKEVKVKPILYKINSEKVEEYIPSTIEKKKVEEYIIKALEYYAKCGEGDV